MKSALILLAEGFEEMEAIGTMDILRRGNINTSSASITGDLTVYGAHNIIVRADACMDELLVDQFDALILPGGGPGSQQLRDNENVRQLVANYCKLQKLVAAICAAPRVLGAAGILKGKKATCYPGIENELKDATVIDAPVVTDGNIITAKGPAYVFDFAFAILDYLYNDNTVSKQIAADLLL
jgi:4-methyl-5(b-hydroxyethyl)-thiazole monophosphate biosynthesis